MHTEPAARPTDGRAATSGLAPLAAGASAAAAAIHFAMVPVHSEQLVDALGFAAAGWFQAALAVLLLLRPASRPVLVAAAAGNAVLIGLWAWSRTAGLPVGAHAGIAEPVEAVDLTAVLLQVVVIAASLVMLSSPSLRVPVLVPAVAGVAALAVASVVIVSPSSATHGHGGAGSAAGVVPVGTGGGHSHGAGNGDAAAHAAEMALVERQRCDWAFNPQAYWQETRILGIDTVAGGVMTADHHASGAGVVDSVLPSRLRGRGSERLDKLVALTSQAYSEVQAGRLVSELAEASDAEYAAWLEWIRRSGAAGHDHAGSTPSSLAPDDNAGHGGHVGPHPWKALIDPEDCDALAKEIELARRTALRYPTAADATKAGWIRVTPYVPGIAAHYMNFGLVDGRFEVDKPEMILYDGNGPDARVVGLSYYVVLDGNAEPTQGFTGDNDHYHRHIGLCVGPGGVIGDSTTTPEDCAARGGRKASGSNGWMSHAWVVPGCESPWGLFSGANPILDSELARQSGKNDGGCSAAKARARYDLSPGRAPLPGTGSSVGVAARR
jgi:hypothetical protein